jgi:hypothetical protein
MMFPSRPFGSDEEPTEYGQEVEPYHDPTPLDLILADKVLQWRCKVFLDLGLTLEQARVLTLQKDADLNVARDYRKRGCPPHLVFDLLAA